MFKKSAWDVVLITLSSMVNKMAILGINLILAKFSTTEAYGMFALLRNSVNLVETTISSSVNPVMIRTSARNFGNEAEFARTNSLLLLVGLGIVGTAGLVVWFFAGPISLTLFNNPNSHLVHLCALLLVVTHSSGLITNFMVTGRVTAFLPAASIVAALAALSLAFAFMPGSPVIWAILSLIALHGLDFLLKVAFSVWRKIVSVHMLGRMHHDALSVFSSLLLTMILSSAITALTFWLLRVILVKSNGNFTSLALFDVGFQYLAVEMMVINNMVTVYQARAAGRGRSDPSERRLIYTSGIYLIALITLAAGAINLLFADFLIGLYGKDYDPQILRVLAAVLPFYAMALAMNRNFVNQGRAGVLLTVSVVSSTVVLLYAQLLMSNAYHLAFAFIIYYLVSNLIYLWFAWKRTRPADA